MATTKKKTKRKATRKKTTPGSSSKKQAAAQKSSEPEYMVQIMEPKMVRKDILESLREVIIFMQGYEAFRRIQEEKVMRLAALKSDVKELNSLINKLRKHLPKGKLQAVKREQKKKEETARRQDPFQREEKGVEMYQQSSEPEMPVPIVETKEKPQDDLAELEAQLRDIESQLTSIK